MFIRVTVGFGKIIPWQSGGPQGEDVYPGLRVRCLAQEHVNGSEYHIFHSLPVKLPIVLSFEPFLRQESLIS